MTTWILVCDASRAKLFSTELREHDWSLVKEFDHPESRETSKEIWPSSPPGRAQQSTSHGARHTSLEQHTSPKEAEAQRFGHQLADYLEHAITKREFDALVLVAPPHFLGILRATLKSQAAKQLRTTVDKDYCMLPAAEVRERLIDTVFPLNPASS